MATDTGPDMHDVAVLLGADVGVAAGLPIRQTLISDIARVGR